MVRKYQAEEFIDGFDDDINSVVPFNETVTSYGADFQVESIASRIDLGKIYVPEFQRKYIWKIPEASRFIESLLLGLPVPGVFLAQDLDGRYMIIDGQQRLLSIYYFLKGNSGSGEGFALSGVGDIFNGMTFQDLPEEYKNRFLDSIIHATIVRQDNQNFENSSIFHIFERLNTGGKQLEPQEIRNCMYPGDFQAALSEVNEADAWRKVYGHPSLRYKDQELILRFVALYLSLDDYAPPMKSFLNRFMGMNRNFESADIKGVVKLFVRTIEILYSAVGERLFRPSKNFNAAIFDSVCYGVAKRLSLSPIKDVSHLLNVYEGLLEDPNFKEAYSQSTSTSSKLRARLRMAERVFSEVS